MHWNSAPLEHRNWGISPCYRHIAPLERKTIPLPRLLAFPRSPVPPFGRRCFYLRIFGAVTNRPYRLLREFGRRCFQLRRLFPLVLYALFLPADIRCGYKPHLPGESVTGLADWAICRYDAVTAHGVCLLLLMSTYFYHSLNLLEHQLVRWYNQV